MQVAATLVLLVTCELCLAIRVPVNWDESASEVKQEIKNDNDQFSVESFKPETINDENVNINLQDDTSIPVEYFQYTAKKPQFAVDVSKFHGVQSPNNHYKAYPIKPYTGKTKPELGKHHLFDQKNTVHKPFQEFTNINEDIVSHAVPVSSNYEVFHPYEAETPALQEIYKDPILNKIRNDLENSKNRHQAYEKEAGEQDIKQNEYLESPDITDNKFIPQGNKHAPYEIHRPQRRPVYYRPVVKNHHREHHLNQRLRHPWNQYSAKIRPLHYRPVKNHIQQLRQNHALKYDDERNEYPQVHILENYSSDPQDGYDIYERGKDKFVQLRNNVDESINKAVKENRPATYQKLEMQNEDHPETYNENDEEFVPIKNYAQVRKTETYKHLPRSAALEDAENFDEIRNAPRLREAVKSTKAQTVYSEEGYEDSAYDHAGEQKHASENEGHGGYLKEHELSGGKYKTPSESAKYEDEKSSAFRDHVIHAEKWKNDNTDTKEENIEEDYSENEQEEAFETKKDKDFLPEDVIYRNKRENDIKNDSSTDLSIKTDKTKKAVDIHNRNENYKVPELDFKSTFLTEDEIIKLSKIRVEPKKDNIKDKYPYYFKNLESISKHSPLRYAENLKLIPKKSKGGTEFYDSRSKFECPEVDDVPNPIPEKLNRDGHPDDNSDEDKENSSTKGDVNYDTANKTPRLKGLGDKIDCFKAKYFGENPLDSPFFKEEIILNPEPVTLPNLTSYKLNSKSMYKTDSIVAESQHKTALLDPTMKQKVVDSPDVYNLIEKLRNGQIKTLDSLKNNNYSIWSPTKTNISKTSDQQLNNIKYSIKGEEITLDNNVNITKYLTNTTTTLPGNSITNGSDQNKKDITLLPSVRKKRSTSFVYEPYKIIKEGQVQDSKKTTTSSNISPLIRQLQLSRVVDRVPRLNQEAEQLEKHVKRNVNTRVYKEVDRKNRALGESKNDKEFIDPTFVDVSVDSRRGEPRYEIIQSNHKSKYSPTENKKSMSVEEYKLQTGKGKEITKTLKGETSTKKQSQQTTPTMRLDNNAYTLAEPSNTVQKKVSLTSKNSAPLPAKGSEEDYEEYDDEEESIAITTTTQKPSFRRKIRPPTISEKKLENVEKPKLKLVTRFRDYKSKEDADKLIPEKDESKSRKLTEGQRQVIFDETIPKYREKKKKSTKSTLVTDTKRYGDENDDENERKEEVDAMIRINQDMDDYMPLYELEEKNKLRTKDVDKIKESYNKDKKDGHVEKRYKNKNSNDDALKTDDNTDETEDDEDYDENDAHDVDDDDDDEIEDDDDDDDDDDSHEDEESQDDEDNVSEDEVHATTPEPTRRTLAITTDAPKPTTASRITRPELTPIVTRKKIEIQNELPVNKSAPHITQFKQDIKEVEIIKETPTLNKKKPQKNLEALELYKDDNLAKDINKLGGVEIFKEGIDLKNGPRHGGNYRSLDSADANVSLKKERESKHNKEDTEASQSEFTKHIELEQNIPSNKMHGGNFRSLNDAHRSRNRGRSSELIELSDAPSTLMHGGNLRQRGKGRNSSKSQKIVELDDDHDDQDDHDPSNNHESFSNSRTSRPMHGGNYRSAKIVTEEKPKSIDQPIRSRTTGLRRNSAAILNSFVQVAPILTTTPTYILDPSKRMYYYVDA